MIRLAAVALLGCPFLHGCGGEASPARQSNSATTYAPADLYVHPLSSFRQHPDGTLQAHVYVQVLDADGFPMRARGQLEVDLSQGNSGDQAVMVRRSWTCDLRTDETNLAHFDPMTRAYVVPFEIDSALPPRSPRIRAIFHGVDASSMSASGVLAAAFSGAHPSGGSPNARGEALV